MSRPLAAVCRRWEEHPLPLASTHAYKNFEPPVFLSHFFITMSALAFLFGGYCLPYLLIDLFISISIFYDPFSYVTEGLFVFVVNCW